MTEPDRRRAAIRLVAGGLVVAAVWCGLLPRLLEFGPVARHVRLMEARGVVPPAGVDTEHQRQPLRPAWIDDVLTLWP
jgi:hypothetical protein